MISNLSSAKGGNSLQSAEFSRHAWIKSEAEYRELCRQAEQDPRNFGLNEHDNSIGSSRSIKYWSGGRLCQMVPRRGAKCLLQLRRPPSQGLRRNKAALIWEGEPGDSRVLTYQMLASEVARCANG